MAISWPKSLLHIFALLLAIGVGSLFFIFAAAIGSLSITLRMLLAEVSVVLALFGIYPFIPWFSSRLKFYLSLVCVPVIIACGWYFLGYLPDRSGAGLAARQLASDLISESTSNGIIEIGFAYPIYTPTITITNHDLYTYEVDVYLRIIDGNNEPALFRAVRSELPDSRLSVEATVNGLLSENSGFIFIPIVVPPGHTVEGKVVFIISNLNDGTSFNEALGKSYQAEFELRQPETGNLLLSFPLTRN